MARTWFSLYNKTYIFGSPEIDVVILIIYLIKFMPKVSVIIPVYNVEAYLRQCLNSVVKQTLREIEIICVDDGSTDSSWVILEEYAAKDGRIKIIKQKNAGAGAARNAGLSLAIGEWLLFLDSDDLLENKCLEAAYLEAKRTDVDLVVYRAYEMDALSHKRSPLAYLNRIIPFADAKVHSVDELGDQRFTTFGLAPWNKLIRRSLVLENQLLFQPIRRSNDLAFSVELLACAKTFIALEGLLVSYRVNNSFSLQSTNAETPTCFYDALREASHRLNGKYKVAFIELVRETAIYNLHSVRTLESYRILANYLEEKIEADFGIKIHVSAIKRLNKASFKVIRMLETLRDRGFLFCFKKLIAKARLRRS